MYFEDQSGGRLHQETLQKLNWCTFQPDLDKTLLWEAIHLHLETIPVLDLMFGTSLSCNLSLIMTVPFEDPVNCQPFKCHPVSAFLPFVGCHYHVYWPSADAVTFFFLCSAPKGQQCDHSACHLKLSSLCVPAITGCVLCVTSFGPFVSETEKAAVQLDSHCSETFCLLITLYLRFLRRP